MSSTTPTPSKRSKMRKVLLMGKSGAGKSSMRSIIFSNYVARDVRRLGATIDVEHSHVRFMGNLMLNLWDCGGQAGYMDSYLTSQHDRGFTGGAGAGGSGGQREYIFKDVAVLIFVFDVESREFAADMVSYGRVIGAMGDASPGAKVFVLIHKMDLVQAHLRQRLFDERAAYIRKASQTFEETVQFNATSIWDQSLYKAWTAVIYTLLPHTSAIEDLLRKLSIALDAREMILYERTTCLTITSVTRGAEAANPFHDRFERLSSILKTHKHSIAQHCRVPASLAHFAGLELKTSRFMFFVCRLTENTNLAVTLPPSEMGFNAAKVNIMMARPRFVELDVGSDGKGKVRMDQETWLSGAARDVKPLTAKENPVASGVTEPKTTESPKG
ncbi:MAG: GTP-binding protein gtr1 [Chrysothrix sp. TS-e1954]|nr:MAG: GTP-binding protein gtr1 [Chrysothrix sp. TS-e1954]